MRSHPDEQILATYAASLPSDEEQENVRSHVVGCSECADAVHEYQRIAALLPTWREAPPELIATTERAVGQRLRLRRLLDRLLSDSTLQRQAAKDPAKLLSENGIMPSPQLLAAFKDLGLSQPERFRGSLDERITKLFRLLE